LEIEYSNVVATSVSICCSHWSGISRVGHGKQHVQKLSPVSSYLAVSDAYAQDDCFCTLVHTPFSKVSCDSPSLAAFSVHRWCRPPSGLIHCPPTARGRGGEGADLPHCRPPLVYRRPLTPSNLTGTVSTSITQNSNPNLTAAAPINPPTV
jgi:hypothetical protein